MTSENITKERWDQLGLPPMELAESSENSRDNNGLYKCLLSSLQKLIVIMLLSVFGVGTYILLLKISENYDNARNTEIIIVTGNSDIPNVTVHNMEIFLQLKNDTSDPKSISEPKTKRKKRHTISPGDSSLVIEDPILNLNDEQLENAREVILNHDVLCNNEEKQEICKNFVSKLKAIAQDDTKTNEDVARITSKVNDNDQNIDRKTKKVDEVPADLTKRQALPITNLDSIIESVPTIPMETRAATPFTNANVLPHSHSISPQQLTDTCLLARLLKQNYPSAKGIYNPTSEYLEPHYDHSLLPHSRYFSPAVHVPYLQERHIDLQRRKIHPQDVDILMSFLTSKSEPTAPERASNTSQETTCPSGTIPCLSGDTCVDEKQWCDGNVDCIDVSDEARCTCKARVDKSRLCDGYFDCPFGEDEMGCYGCSENMFSCEDINMNSQSTCFTKEQRCNNVVECPNHKDELECNMLAPSLLKKPLFAISNTEGFLHRNFKGDWYAVCKNPYMWAHDACRRETGLIIRPPFIQILPIDPMLKIDYLNTGPGGLIQTSDTCMNSSAVYVTCPDMLCGTRVQSTSQLLRETAAIENHLFGRNKRFLKKKHPYPLMFYGNRLKRNVDKTGTKRNYEIKFDTLKKDFFDTTRNKRTESRVVGGKPSQPAAWPWMVAVYRNGMFHCGGVVINHSWIVSAAHCVHKFWDYYYEVQVGMLRRFSFSPQEQNHRVTHVIVNQHYSQTDMKNDLSLLKVEPAIQFSRWVRPICLPSPDTAGPDWLWGPSPGTICTAVGWGATTEHGPDPDHMREVEVPIWEKCKHQEDRAGKEICAGLVEGGKDACQGDSGGPLLCRNPLNSQQWYMAGIVSHGDGCARKDEPGVYTRVSLFVKWIKYHISSKTLPIVQPVQECPGFKCETGISKCLPNKRKCDKIVDCLDGEDETKCEFTKTFSFADIITTYPKNTLDKLFETKEAQTKSIATSSKEEKTKPAKMPLDDVASTPRLESEEIITSTDSVITNDRNSENFDSITSTKENADINTHSKESSDSEKPDFEHASTLEIINEKSLETTAFSEDTAVSEISTETTSQSRSDPINVTSAVTTSQSRGDPIGESDLINVSSAETTSKSQGDSIGEFDSINVTSAESTSQNHGDPINVTSTATTSQSRGDPIGESDPINVTSAETTSQSRPHPIGESDLMNVTSAETTSQSRGDPIGESDLINVTSAETTSQSQRDPIGVSDPINVTSAETTSQNQRDPINESDPINETSAETTSQSQRDPIGESDPINVTSMETTSQSRGDPIGEPVPTNVTSTENTFQSRDDPIDESDRINVTSAENTSQSRGDPIDESDLINVTSAETTSQNRGDLIGKSDPTNVTSTDTTSQSRDDPVNKSNSLSVTSTETTQSRDDAEIITMDISRESLESRSSILERVTETTTQKQTTEEHANSFEGFTDDQNLFETKLETSSTPIMHNKFIESIEKKDTTTPLTIFAKHLENKVENKANLHIELLPNSNSDQKGTDTTFINDSRNITVSLHQENSSAKKLTDFEDKSDTINIIEDTVFMELQPAKLRRKHRIPNEFECRRIEQTIPYNQRCNRKADCEDGTDELDCTCTDFLSTFDEKLICDGVIDCADGQDESDCFSCPEDHFLCKRSRICLPEKHVCDGRSECPQGEDELNCFALSNGKEIEFDLDERPVVNLEGYLTKRHFNDWHVVCDDKLSLEQQEQAATHICRYLGFSSANRYNVKYINLKEDEIAERSLDNKRSRRDTVERVPIHFAYRQESVENDTARHTIIKEPQVIKEQCIPNITKTCKSLYVFCDNSLFTDFDDSGNMFLRETELVSNHTWPWIAKVFIEGDYRCTGVLVNLSWVLVSDSCLWDSTLSHHFITVVLGSHRTLGGMNGMHEQVYQVDSKKDVYRSKASLLHLKEPAHYSNAVKPMVVSSSYSLEQKSTCVAVGQDDKNNTISVFLEETSENCHPSNRCFKRKSNENICPLETASHRHWAGIVSCHTEQGWYPAATFVDGRGECGLGDHINATDIENLKNEIKYHYGKKTLPSLIDQHYGDDCEGARCARGRCVRLLQVCDGVRDCEDGNDESESACDKKHKMCDKDPYHRGCECSVGQMKCRNGKCISKELFRDGNNDCGDGTDEPGQTTCSNYLARVMPSRLCDGILHCHDRSDEDPMFCKCFAKKYYKCGSKSGVDHCVAPDTVCDGIRDCPNGEDEQTCIGLNAPQGTPYGTGQVIVRSHGVWHSKCYPSQNHTKSELEAICSELGFISGHAKQIKEIENFVVHPYNNLVIDPFSEIILNNNTIIKMRNTHEPIAKAVFEELQNCYPVFIECR